MRNLKVYFQTIGVLFEYNLSLTSRLAKYEDLKITVETTNLVLYLYSLCFRRNYQNIKFIMTQPIIPPISQIRNNNITNIVSRSSFYKKFMSKFDILHLSQIEHPYSRTAIEVDKPKVLTIPYFPPRLGDKSKEVLEKTDVLIVPSKFLSKLIYETHGYSSKVIYFGVDTAVFNTLISKTRARKFLGLPISKKIILWNGRLDPNKDLKTLIDAIPIVVKEMPDCLFLVKGRSKKSNAINRYIKTKLKKKGFNKNLILNTGWDFLTKMPYYYRSADVFAHTSLFETFGFVFVEAMACGVPVVACSTSTVPEIVGDAGLQCEPKNAEDLADKILKILVNDKLGNQLSERGSKKICELGLTWENTAEQYRKLYFSVL